MIDERDSLIKSRVTDQSVMTDVHVGLDFTRGGCSFWMIEPLSSRFDSFADLSRWYSEEYKNETMKIREVSIMLADRPGHPMNMNIAFGAEFYNAKIIVIADVSINVGFAEDRPFTIEGIENYIHLEKLICCVPVRDIPGIEFCSELTQFMTFGNFNLSSLSGLKLTKLAIDDCDLTANGGVGCLSLESLKKLCVNPEHIQHLGDGSRFPSLEQLIINIDKELTTELVADYVAHLFGNSCPDKEPLDNRLGGTGNAMMPCLFKRFSHWKWDGSMELEIYFEGGRDNLD